MRPDKQEVVYKYDALGRRIWKKISKTVTKWLWDGNKVLHEYKEFAFRESTADDLITWIFEEDSFAPVAKIKGEKKYSLICDHIGTPIQGYNEEGSLIWERELDSYGKVRMLEGDEGFTYFTYQGQVYDKDIDLTYNFMRWYDQSEGIYASSDPIGLEGGERLYAYVHDPNSWVDIFGLTGIIYLRIDPKTKREYIGKSKSPEAYKRRQTAHNTNRKKAMGDNYDNKRYRFIELEENVRGKKNLQNREQANIDKKGGIKNLENKINAKRKKTGCENKNK